MDISNLVAFLEGASDEEKRAFFAFDSNDSDERVLVKFDRFARHLYPRYFQQPTAPFHAEMVFGYLRSYRHNEDFINLGFRGCAKRQPLTAKILTPNGFTTMGELSVGDEVIGADGKPTTVEFMSEIVERETFELTTEDGRKTQCDGEHLWTVRMMSNVRQKFVTLDTNLLLKKGLAYKRVDKRNGRAFNEYKFALPLVKPVHFTHKNLPIDPYTLGVVIGDGSVSKKTGSTKITFHKDDEQHYRENIPNMGDTWWDKRNASTGTCTIVGVHESMRELGLLNNALDKHIPEKYLHGDVEQRIALLQGLMDTDGTAGSGTPSFSTISERLADDVVFLVRSLGGRATKTVNKYLESQVSKTTDRYYRVSIILAGIPVFRMKRKQDKVLRTTKDFTRIVSIEPVGITRGRCIKVSNEDGLYVTDDFIVTHNTTLAKLFILFVLLNDVDMTKKYIKFLTKDLRNSKQLVTDVYNMMVEVKGLYGDVFITDKEIKREETMSTFTLSDGRKIAAGTVGTTHRGHIQDAYRPDWIIFDDIEDKESIQSLPITQGIIDKCDEALTGLAIESSFVVLGNYISAQGTVQWFLNKPHVKRLITPILEDDKPTWDVFTLQDIEKLKFSTQDFFGEYMCDPERSDNRYFDPIKMDESFLLAKAPFRSFQGVRYWENYVQGHRYGAGADVGEGSGKDSSTIALFDFTSGTLVATFHSNRIPPIQLAKEMMRLGEEYGNCILAPERNNNGVAVLENMREYPFIYTETTAGNKSLKKTDRMGWHTNKKTKPLMFEEFRKDYHDGKITIYDKDVLNEMRSFAYGDINDSMKSLVTRHFDLLTAVVIAWQMRKHAIAHNMNVDFVEEAPIYEDIGV